VLPTCLSLLRKMEVRRAVGEERRRWHSRQQAPFPYMLCSSAPPASARRKTRSVDDSGKPKDCELRADVRVFSRRVQPTQWLTPPRSSGCAVYFSDMTDRDRAPQYRNLAVLPGDQGVRGDERAKRTRLAKGDGDVADHQPRAYNKGGK
jgi:hypothetical protein